MMAENSKIEWCDHTMNFWIGCTEVSPACDNCYARQQSQRYGWAQWGNHPRHRTSTNNWHKPLAWNAKAAKAGVRYRVFTNSLSDFFDNQVPWEWREEAWNIINGTPHLDWMILTKRPQNIFRMLPEPWDDRWSGVWLGTTVENQEEADRRIPQLLAVPAVVRFLSCEPLLGLVNLDRWLHPGMRELPDDGGGMLSPLLDLVIIGGESGPKARPYYFDWAQSLIDQCRGAGVPCFHKQLGAHPIGFDGRRVWLRDKKGGDPGAWPKSLRVRQMPERADA